VDSLFRLDGRIAIVTGVLGKLGPVWAEALLDAGARVAGIDLPGAAPSDTFLSVRNRFENSLVLYRADILDRGALEEVRERCLAELGVPSILVNNAGIDQPPNEPVKTYLLNEIPLEVCRKVLDVNVLGAFQVIQVFAKDMLEAGQGSIINIGSLYASVAPDSRFYDHLPYNPPFLKPPAYGASKAALVNLTKYLAALWGPYGVRVNALSPGGVESGQDPEFKRKFCSRVPLGRMAQFRDLAGPLLFLASDASAYVTGIELKVDGGFTAW
jgi:NAD(P)-dependent dehydrogenase (short-subunit alcohol dehydrogenase family)